MTYSKKIAFNTAAQFVGKIISTAISLATFAVLYRTLGIEGIGKYTTVFAFVAFFAVFADFGLQWTLIRELSVNPQNKNKIFGNIFFFRLILAIVVFLVAFGAVWFLNYPYDVKVAVGLISLGWFFTTINSTFIGVFLNNYRMDISVAGDIIGRAITLGLIIFMAKLGYGFYYLMGAYVVGNFVNIVYSYVFVGKFVKIAFRFDYKYWKYVIDQAFAIGIVLVFGFIYYKIDSLMLSLMKGMTDVGIYGSAYKLLEVLTTIPSMFLGAAFPLITAYIAKKDARVMPAFQKQFDFLMLIALPIMGGVLVTSNQIIKFIAGSRGAEFVGTSTVTFAGIPITSAIILQILIFAVGIHFLSNLYNYMIVSLGKQKSMVWPTVFFAGFNVVLNLLLIPKFSYLGAAVSTVLTEIAVVLFYKVITDKNICLPINLNSFARILFSSILMSIIIYYFARLGYGIITLIIIGAVFYGAFIFIFKAVPKNLIKSIISRQ